MADETGAEVAKYEQEQIMPIAVIKRQFQHLHELMSDVLKKDEDYGVIPGTGKKPTLLKPGAEKICTMFRLDPQFEVLRRELDEDFILFDVKCDMYSITTGNRLGSGLGSCSSREEKYSWKKANSKDEYEATSPDRRRIKIGVDRDGKTYNIQQVRMNPYDVMNTIEKMACKRALVAATLISTNASAIFTQDLEDLKDTGASTGGDGGTATPEVKLVTEGQVKLMHVLFGKCKITDDAAKYVYAGTFLNHEVKHLKDLPMDEGRKLIDHLQEEAKKSAA